MSEPPIVPGPGGRVHVVPVFPCEPEHVAETDCWCEPELSHRDLLTAGEVWTHRRLQ